MKVKQSVAYTDRYKQAYAQIWILTVQGVSTL